MGVMLLPHKAAMSLQALPKHSTHHQSTFHALNVTPYPLWRILGIALYALAAIMN